ncbi:sialic acid-binding Ig-like lectin 13 isoform X2 [Labeo rohita]|uniref:sialic acid-binding Ig-like lectin 13 isoform X2 n=1 Tax=Labeo rohita TaxID=84645 RepID=UPI0021E21DC4|nr:sialic acid-binding Ig-like lectin 13 isoform X2 [Labeo rohita]XP_050959251.1 sialic acid-binding Ig-like lectin 13 isoform X2 [Labeo rohita]XP_050959252.1 sialic acid-binding Ig-like lectin 13 isoform X2 [Labeo rohita]XP_050959253.1 sialic acid-binding Ig-like lectin 13 isoform X2 [Labeo rohita]XP_050959254.1 sialic acid-binding Ig-like lectin 13 isoform X2 [Labeo rohita]
MDTAEKIIFFCFLLQGVCCRDFSISLPEKIEPLSGSCVIINCRFEINETYDKDLTATATGLWLKNGTDVNKNLVFSSTSSQNSFIRGNITGKLKDRNCTTVFYEVRSIQSGQYYFRIEGKGGLKWTYAKTSVSIHVIESPPKPRVQLYVEQKEVKDQEEVLEGRSVSLRCSAETLCSSPPPTLTWSSTPRIPLSESSRLQELISDLNFTATHRQHRVTFTCTITYQLQDKNKTAQNNITLHVQHAPKISNLSSCSQTDATVCFCEVDGNPSPELRWHLSGRPVTNSSNTLISEERLSSTGLRSFITLHQSLTNTSTLQCVSNNTHGTASQLFLLFPCVTSLKLLSVLIEVAVGALVVMMMCVITYTCVRKEKCLQTRSVGATRNFSTNESTAQENEGEPVYSNNAMMSSAGATTVKPESIIYSSIVFKNTQPREVVSISSLHADYAVVQDCSEDLAKTKSSIGESSRAREAQMIVSADVLNKQTESKQSEEELFVGSSQLYAKVKHRNP